MEFDNLMLKYIWKNNAPEVTVIFHMAFIIY